MKFLKLILIYLLCLAMLITGVSCNDDGTDDGSDAGGGGNQEGQGGSGEKSGPDLYISFFGDSITTYQGWTNNTELNSTMGNNPIYYPSSYNPNFAVEDTWWHRVANAPGYEFCLNNSWSGGRVEMSDTYNNRARNLHNTTTGQQPDIIVILMGVNDWASAISVGDYDGSTPIPTSPRNFSESYGRMVEVMKMAYPNADIYCCSFIADCKRGDGNGVNTSGVNQTVYNDAIREIAENMGVYFIDVYNECGISFSNADQYTEDRLHPNSVGMQMVADVILAHLDANY